MNPSDPANSNASDTESDDRNSPNYLLQFGFLQAPFSTHLDDNMYYADPGQKQRLDLMLHLTQFSEDVLILTGVTGAGKTTLAYQFLQQAHASWQTCMIAATNTTNGTQLLRQINHCFQLQSQSQILEQMLQEVKDRLSEKLSDPGPHIILVDDAHLLNAETLSVLLELAKLHDASEKQQLHMLLLAEPSIKSKLLEPEAAPTRHVKMRKMEIPALNRFHSDALLHFRLRVAGCNDRIITDKVLARIFKESGGIPGKLCSAAHEYLTQQASVKIGQQSSSDEGNSAGIKRVALMVVVIIATALLIFQDKVNHFLNSSKPTLSSKPTVEKKIELPALTRSKTEEKNYPAMTSAEQDSSQNNDDQAQNPSLSEESQKQTLAPENTRFDHLTTDAPTTLENKRNLALEKIQSQLKKLEKKRRRQPTSQMPVIPDFTLSQEPSADSNEGPSAESNEEPLAESNEEPLAESNEEPSADSNEEPSALPNKEPSAKANRETSAIKGPLAEKQPSANQKPSANKNAKERSGPVLFPATEQSMQLQNTETLNKKQPSLKKPPPPAATPNPLALTRDQRWIRQQSGQNYTLQLISGYQLNTLRRFIKQHRLAPKELSYYLSYNKQGKAWHSLLYGSYPDLKSARNAAQALSQSSSIKKPWIRKFSNIHWELRARPKHATRD